MKNYRLLNQEVILKLFPVVLDEADKYKLCRWVNECLIDYLRYAGRIVNLEYHYFIYEGKKEKPEKNDRSAF